MVRIDMSEFMEKHSVARLIGAPPGYVGFEEGGYLTEAVRRRPYSVVLLDEIEKAHPDVFNVLLQVLEDGRLTDGHGRTVDFRNCVVVMTSNLGSHAVRELAQGNDRDDAIRRAVMASVTEHFRPEFINRIDEIVVFHGLDAAQIHAIARIQLERLTRRLADQHLALDVSDAAMTLLGEAGFDRRLRCPPTEARDSAAPRESARTGSAGRRVLAPAISWCVDVAAGKHRAYDPDGPSAA